LRIHYRDHLGTPGFRTRQITLVTTLLDAEVYRVADLAELYRQRWQVETSRAHLKTTMHLDVLHCKTVAGVLKELTIFAMVYHLVRLVMQQSAILQHTAVERISFLDALRWLSAPSTGRP
jgi:IS4 transposase